MSESPRLVSVELDEQGVQLIQDVVQQEIPQECSYEYHLAVAAIVLSAAINVTQECPTLGPKRLVVLATLQDTTFCICVLILGAVLLLIIAISGQIDACIQPLVLVLITYVMLANAVTRLVYRSEEILASLDMLLLTGSTSRCIQALIAMAASAVQSAMGGLPREARSAIIDGLSTVGSQVKHDFDAPIPNQSPDLVTTRSAAQRFAIEGIPGNINGILSWRLAAMSSGSLEHLREAISRLSNAAVSFRSAVSWLLAGWALVFVPVDSGEATPFLPVTIMAMFVVPMAKLAAVLFSLAACALSLFALTATLPRVVIGFTVLGVLRALCITDGTYSIARSHFHWLERIEWRPETVVEVPDQAYPPRWHWYMASILTRKEGGGVTPVSDVSDPYTFAIRLGADLWLGAAGHCAGQGAAKLRRRLALEEQRETQLDSFGATYCSAADMKHSQEVVAKWDAQACQQVVEGKPLDSKSECAQGSQGSVKHVGST